MNLQYNPQRDKTSAYQVCFELVKLLENYNTAQFSSKLRSFKLSDLEEFL